jgi:hypothetical protein
VPTLGRLHEWRRDPLVVGAAIDGRRGVDVVARQVAARYGGVMFVGVVATRDVEQLDALLSSPLRRHLDEMIFTTSAPPALDSSTASWRALEQHGVGQDFVFEVPVLADAVWYAVEAVATRRWEGTACLVMGGRGALTEARAALRGETR